MMDETIFWAETEEEKALLDALFDRNLREFTALLESGINPNFRIPVSKKGELRRNL